MKKALFISVMLSAMLISACSTQTGESDPIGNSSSGAPAQSSSQPAAESSSSESQTFTVSLNKTELSLTINGSEQLTATSNMAGASIVWSSSDAETVSIDQLGNVTGLKEGTATVTATIKDRQESASCEVTVVGDYFIKEETSIVVETSSNDTNGQILQDAIAALQKKEPKLTVKYTKFSGSYNDLKEDAIKGYSAGNYPDVIVAYPDAVADFINANMQLNMNKYIDNEDYGWTDEERDDFYASDLKEGSSYAVRGTYSLPFAKSTEAMYYDEDKLIGLNLGATINGGKALDENYFNNLTWDELFNKLCPALLNYRESLSSDELKKAFLDTSESDKWSVVGYDSDDNLFITLANQYGYGYTSIDEITKTGIVDFVNDGMKGLMKQFNGYKQNKYLHTAGTLGERTNKPFGEDKVLLSIGSTGGVSYQFNSNNPKNIKVARIPQADLSNPKNIQQGPSLAFLKHPDNTDNRGLGAWLFYKEITSVNNCIAWVTTSGYSPVRKSVSESDDFLDFADPDNHPNKTIDRLKALNAVYADSVANSLFSSPVFKGSSEAREQVGSLVTDILLKENLTDADVDAAFKKAYDNTILAIEGK